MPTSTRYALPLVAASLLCVGVGVARALPPGYTVETVHSGLSWAAGLRFAPDGRLFYLELISGRVMVYPSAFIPVAETWAWLPVVHVNDERGLLGMAFHWDFPDTPYVYLFHTNPSPLVDRVVRMTDEGGIGTNYTVFHEVFPADNLVHHGGRLAFGPDRMLYVTTGDLGTSSAAQDPQDSRGKILRLGPGGKAAPGNPFGPGTPAALLGVRNVFGLCFDPVDGTGYFTENGPECDDELNVLTLGENYGWGPTDACAGQPPGSYPWLASFTPAIAPTGCAVYRGNVFPAHLDGNLFFASFNDRAIRRVKFQPGSVTLVDTLEVFATLGEEVLDLTVGPDGHLWFCTFSSIGRIVAPGAVSVEPRAETPALTTAPNPFRDRVTFAATGGPGIDRIEVFDLSGRRVFARAGLEAGRVTWDGRSDRGEPVPAGVYLVTASGRDFLAKRRVVRVGR